jgi:large subunit ribosomal protein L5
MRRVFIGKVVVHIAVGESGERLQNAAKVLEMLTGQKPTFRRAKKTIKEFGVKRGENIACMVTLRGARAYEFLKKALAAGRLHDQEEQHRRKGELRFRH